MRITTEQALARLQSLGKRKSKGVKVLDLDTVGVVKDGIYIFGNADGGILCPAYDTLPPVLGTWEEGGEIPPALQDMLQEYSNEVEWLERVGETMEAPTQAPAKTKAAPRQSIPAMLKTKWSQKAPYNDMCIFEGKRCVTGCNATAAAQLMYYWGTEGYHRGCKATDAYTTSTNGYDVDAMPAKVVFDYANLVAKPKTDEQKKAVAELMAYLGRTFHSNYTPKGTGAYLYKVADYLRENFRMGSFISYITAAKLGLKSFENYIYNELLQGRPVIVGGHLDSGHGGHAFILDGYDAEQDLYHVNWGWGGSYDGWFKITALNPTTAYAFNSSREAVIGIQPEYRLGDINGDGEIDITDVMQVVQDANQGKYSEKADINNDGQVTITDAMVILDKVLGKGEL